MIDYKTTEIVVAKDISQSDFDKLIAILNNSPYKIAKDTSLHRFNVFSDTGRYVRLNNTNAYQGYDWSNLSNKITLQQLFKIQTPKLLYNFKL